ncbi:MAG: mechanosensitive ion channel family protein [Candidatus Eisenbacteria bacterium]|nr:mechanosensitive ion channel family protein [Candidatus Eisenbacteria bacterium]
MVDTVAVAQREGILSSAHLAKGLIGIEWALGYAAIALFIGMILYITLTLLKRTRLISERGIIRLLAAKARFFLSLFAAFLSFYFLSAKRLAVLIDAEKGLFVAILIVLIFLIIKILDAFVYHIFEWRGRVAPLPSLLHDLIILLIYFTVFLVVLKAAYNIKLSGFLVSSAVLTMILGLALQDTLGSLIAGLTMHFEKTCHVGDWITVGNVTGEVVLLTWRSVKVRTFSGDIAVLPNSVISKSDLVNHSLPDIRHRPSIEVGTSYLAPPNKVIEILESTALETPGCLPEPRPTAFLVGYGEHSINYRLFFWASDFFAARGVGSRILVRIWYNLKRAGIVIPFPIRTVHMHEITPEREAKERTEEIIEFVSRLKGVDFLAPLPEESLRIVASNLKRMIFAKGEVLFREGDLGHSLFIVETGGARIKKAGESGREIILAQLGPGSFFGEMSLLTGEARSGTAETTEDSTFLIVDKNDFEGILKANPASAETISNIVAERLEATRKEFEKAAYEVAGAKEPTSKKLLSKIKMFFGL